MSANTPTDLLMKIIQFWAEEQGLVTAVPFNPDFADDLIIKGSRGFLTVYYGVDDDDQEDDPDEGAEGELMYTLCPSDHDYIDGHLEAPDPELFPQLQALIDQIR
jgi:hypothetical protein